jgi:hypothetical protein
MERLDQDWLSNSLAADLIRRVVDLHARGGWNGSSSLLHAVDEAGQKLMTEILLRPTPKGEGTAVAGECLATIERIALDQELRGVRQRLAAAGLSAEESDRLQLRALDLRKRMDHIAQLLKDSTRELRH